MQAKVNNDFYHSLGDRWYQAQDDPVALLRAEARARNPWIAESVQRAFGCSARVLDVACGAGFLSNYLAHKGFDTYGVDSSKESLEVARAHAPRAVSYLEADAHHLPFQEGYFDAVCMMDFLEHTETPTVAIEEARRVLKPNGLFFFHTFNRTLLSYLFAVKGLEWFVKNTPPHLHVFRLFIKPKELIYWLERVGFDIEHLQGSRPKFDRAFWKLLFHGSVPDDFSFVQTKSLRVGYTGLARLNRKTRVVEKGTLAG